jgi:hypothetical protein
MFVAGVGTAMAYVVGQDMWLDAVTVNHSPSNPDEEARVLSSGADIETAALDVRTLLTR